MLEPKEDKRLDNLLDAMLSTYSAAEARPGLEGRIRAALKAHAEPRRRPWVLVFVSAAAAIFLIALITKPRAGSRNVSGATVADTVPAPGEFGHKNPAVALSPTLSQKPKPRLVARVGHAKGGARQPNLLQVINAMHEEAALSFEREKVYLAPTSSPETEAETAASATDATAQGSSAPNIKIQDLGVQPLAIQELTPTRVDQRGSL